MSTRSDDRKGARSLLASLPALFAGPFCLALLPAFLRPEKARACCECEVADLDLDLDLGLNENLELLPYDACMRS